MRRLGNPCQGRKVLHVAGTNGKGSVCAYMQAILLFEGKRVGFFTSPHLVKLNERIRINGKDIDDDTFCRIFAKVRQVAEELEKEGLEHPSYFEFLYGMGMLAFEENDAEYIVLETGLGGRLDATNSFEHPFLSVITSIGLDHTEILGDTIEKIAGEKAGIIKKGVPVFFDGSDERSSRVIEETAENVEAPWYKMEKDALKIQEITDKHIAFSILDEYDNNTVWQVASTGIYQVMNAALAIRAMRYTFGDKAEICKWQKVVAEPSVHRNLLPLGEVGSKRFGSRTEQGAIDKHRRIDIFAGLAVLLLLVDGESEGEDTRGIPLFAKLRIAREVAHDGHSVDSHCLSNLSMAFAEDSGILLPGKLSSLAVYKYSRPEYLQPREQDNHIDCTHLRCKDKGV